MKKIVCVAIAGVMLLLPSVGSTQASQASAAENLHAQRIREQCGERVRAIMVRLTQLAASQGAIPQFSRTYQDGSTEEISAQDFYNDGVMLCFIETGLKDAVTAPRIQAFLAANHIQFTQSGVPEPPH